MHACVHACVCACGVRPCMRVVCSVLFFDFAFYIISLCSITIVFFLFL